MISLYFHIPFCTRKCAYCHFYVIPDKDPFKKQLMEGFKLEWAQWLPSIGDKKIVSIYFGGGTPALMGAEAIAEILSWIPNKIEGIEITLEANPENITPELMRSYAQVGINRISIGVQTFNDQQLQVLQRLHSGSKAAEAVYMTAESGVSNISIDLMYDLPGQTLETWESTLKKAVTLPIKHLSLYNLTIEPHTVFFKYRESIQKQLPDPDVSFQMYEMAIEVLELQDLKQYEISAFAKEDLYSRHNTGYWTGRPFLGFGPSAFSYWEGRRFRNIANLNRYLQLLQKGESPIDFDEKLSPEAGLRELLAINLRLLSGVNLDAFQSKNGKLDPETLDTLKRLSFEGFLKQNHGLFSLTKKGDVVLRHPCQ